MTEKTRSCLLKTDFYMKWECIYKEMQTSIEPYSFESNQAISKYSFTSKTWILKFVCFVEIVDILFHSYWILFCSRLIVTRKMTISMEEYTRIYICIIWTIWTLWTILISWNIRKRYLQVNRYNQLQVVWRL